MSVARSLPPESVTELTRNAGPERGVRQRTLGGVLARASRLDLFGFLVIGIVSGLGDGILRGTLLQRGTPVAVTDYTNPTVATVGLLLAFVADLSRHRWSELKEVYRDLHAHPEWGHQEHRTVAGVAERLRDCGYQVAGGNRRHRCGRWAGQRTGSDPLAAGRHGCPAGP